MVTTGKRRSYKWVLCFIYITDQIIIALKNVCGTLRIKFLAGITIKNCHLLVVK
jgi:hypothetical protein